MPADGGVFIDLRDFAEFATSLRLAEPVLYKALRAQLRIAGQLVANDYAFLIGGAGIASVPPSVKVHIQKGSVVTVTGGGPGVPLAGLEEMGNKGKGSGDSFRHPVFNSQTTPWVDQPMHPALGPAVKANADLVEEILAEALNVALEVAVGGGFL
jgi:hypothetical protein